MKKSILEVVVEPQDILLEELRNIKGGIAPITSDCTDGCNSGKIVNGETIFTAW